VIKWTCFRKKNRVWFPSVGTWLSLVEHRVRDAGVAGSNPVVPTSPRPKAFRRWVFIIFVVRSSPVGPDVKNVQKSDHRFFPRLSKSSNRGVVAFSDDRQYTRNRFLFWHRVHRCNYTFQGSSLDYIPWFSSPS
jgi:hypothetical protein